MTTINLKINHFRRRIHSWAYPLACFMLIAVTVAQFTVPAFAQQVVGGPITTIDAMPWLMLILQGLGILVLIIVGWFVYGHVKDQNARNAFLNIAAQAVSYGYNVVAGATKDKTLSVNVGSSVVANALNFLRTYGPDAMVRFGINESDAVKMLWSRLVSVDGSVTDATLSNIVSASKGGIAVTSAGLVGDIPELAEQILAYIKNKPDATTPPAAPSPSIVK